MALADTSRVQLRYIQESSFGVTPGVGNGINLRMTGEGLSYNIRTASSDELRSDRQRSDLVQVGADANGPVNFELSYNEYDALLAALLQGTWEVYGTNGVGSTFAGTYTTSTITAGVAPTGANAFTDLDNGQWIKINAPGGLNDGKWVRIHASTAITSTVITVDPATPLQAEGPIASSSIATSRLTNGSTQRSYTLEKEFADITQFFAYRGMTLARGSLSFESGRIVTGAFEFMGKDGTRAAVTTLPGSPTASKAFDPVNAVSGVGSIFEGTSLLSGTFIKRLTLEIENNLRSRDAIGTLGAVSIGSGEFSVRGSMQVYLNDGSLYDKFVNNTATKLAWRVYDGSYNGYGFVLPRVEYSDAKVTAGAKNQDAMIELPFDVLRDSGSGQTLFIDRCGVTAT